MHSSGTPDFTRHQRIRCSDCNKPFIVNKGMFLSNTFSVLGHSSATVKSSFTCQCESNACLLVSHRSHDKRQEGNLQRRWWPDQRHPWGLIRTRTQARITWQPAAFFTRCIQHKTQLKKWLKRHVLSALCKPKSTATSVGKLSAEWMDEWLVEWYESQFVPPRKCYDAELL